MSLELIVNGRPQILTELSGAATLAESISAMHLKSDRIAVEHNGEISPRSNWSSVIVRPGDRLEIVHFVGGGSSAWK